MPMRQEPAPHRQHHYAQNQKLIANYEAGQDHKGQAAQHQGRTRRHAGDHHLEGWVHQGCEAEHEQANADPHNALEARKLGSQLARGVLLRRAQLCAGVGFLPLDHGHRGAYYEAG